MPFRFTLRRFVLFFLLLLVIWPAAGMAEALECRYLPQLFEIYLRHHYAYKKLTDVLKTRTVEQYIKHLDPLKSLLLQEDVDKLKKDLLATFSTSESADCHELTDASKLLLKRSQENLDFVKSFLGPAYKLDESVEIITDPQKRSFARTEAEKKEILQKLVHFQISNFLLTDMKLPEAKKQLVHRYELVQKRLVEAKPSEDLSAWAESFALSLDPHSSYLSHDDLDDFQISMQLSLEGIGASLTSENGFTVIDSLIPGGGAERSKQLRPQDKIIAVTQGTPESSKPVSVIDMDLRDVVKLIRGKKGTKVRLTILRQKPKSETFDVTIVRDKIDIKEQAAKITYENRKVGGRTMKIGILDLPSFYGGGGKGTRWSSTDVKNLLEEAKKQKVDGIVLNLSKNGGGLLEEAVKISGLFIRKGAVVATKDTDAKVEVLNDQDDELVYTGPLVVLTSRYSASASEILAGALHDYKRAVIVGADHTFGKGSVQAVSGLPGDMGGMKVTTGMFFIPAGASTQHQGVPSDVRVPSVFNSDDVGEDKLDYSLPPQSIPAFISTDANASDPAHHWTPIDDSLVKRLGEKSKIRVAKEPKFAEIKKDIDDSEKNKGIVRLAELRKRMESENKANKKKRKNSHDKNRDLDAPVVAEAVNILADMLEKPNAVADQLLRPQ